MLPASLRKAGKAGTVDNRVSMMMPTLPVDLHDAVRRLRREVAHVAAVVEDDVAELANAAVRLRAEPWTFGIALMDLRPLPGWVSLPMIGALAPESIGR
ncbi:MAG: hypothetical protein HOQ24_12765 [Mycobacteriaceae bacterium]|nr:hypothetical protein [Mycobacteriaceae bacterium]